MSVSVHVSVCVYTLASKLAITGSFYPHLSGECVCVFVCFSLSAGTISAEAKEHRNFERAFYVLLSEMVLRKAFYS